MPVTIRLLKIKGKTITCVGIGSYETECYEIHISIFSNFYKIKLVHCL